MDQNHAGIPVKLKQLRACLLCGLVKSTDQFKRDGCENCENLLRMQGDMDRVFDCTTTTYTGLLAICQPDKSWVARWQRIERVKAGLYAGKVWGRLPESLEEDLVAQGIPVPKEAPAVKKKK